MFGIDTFAWMGLGLLLAALAARPDLGSRGCAARLV